MKNINYKEILTLALTFAIGILIARMASKALAKMNVTSKGSTTTDPETTTPVADATEELPVILPAEEAKTQGDIFNEKFHARGRMHY